MLELFVTVWYSRVCHADMETATAQRLSVVDSYNRAVAACAIVHPNAWAGDFHSTFLGYASRHGGVLIDREVYLRKSWTDDRDRGRAAGVPDEVGFATKVTQGRRMISRALDAGVPAAWVTADEFYGNERGLRRDQQARRVGYVLAVAKNLYRS